MRGLGGASSSSNLFAQSREYLAREIAIQTPLLGDGMEPLETKEVPSWRNLCKNNMLFNAGDPNVHTPQAGGVFKPLQPGSQRTCVLTLSATALGSGVLALPYAFSCVGLVVGVIALVLACSLSSLSLIVLMLASRYTEAQSFSDLLSLAVGSSRVGLLLDICLALYGSAALLALLMFEGDFLPSILEEFGYPNASRTVCIIAVALIAWPTILPADVSVLRYVAALSPFAILFVGANVSIMAPSYYAAKPPSSDVEFVKFEATTLLKASSIFVFSVMCHMNAVPVAHLLERPSVVRIVKVATYTNACILTLYLFIGVGGYLSFQAAVQGDFLKNYPADSIPILICRLMLTVVCFVGLPMNSGPTTQALQKLITAIVRRDASPVVEHRPFVFAMAASSILAAATVGAINLTDVATLISVVGGSLTTLQMFWLPALIYWKILYPTQQDKRFRKVVLAVLLLAGCTGFASVIANVL